MLDIHFFNPLPETEWVIRKFESYRFQGEPVADKFIPRPYISIIFHFGDCPFISGATPVYLKKYFLAPILSQTIELNFQGSMETFVVHCKPTVFARLFSLDLSPQPERSIQLPEEIFLPLWTSLKKISTPEERIIFFSDFVQSVHSSTYTPDAVDMLYDNIVENGISVLLKDMLSNLPASRSTIFRKFVKRTGVSPKTLMRIVRLDYLWSKICNENAYDYQDLVFEGNYFDQSHLINDFKTIVGETPGYFFKRNLDIVKVISGKSASRN